MLSMISEATSQYIARIGEDVEAVLGAGVVLLGVAAVEWAGSVHLRARYQMGGVIHETGATGKTMLAAHAALRMELARDRVRYGFEHLIAGR